MICLLNPIDAIEAPQEPRMHHAFLPSAPLYYRGATPSSACSVSFPSHPPSLTPNPHPAFHDNMIIVTHLTGCVLCVAPSPLERDKA
jgi:hypothetical protein